MKTLVAGIYGRVSTGEQSVEMQLTELLRFCESRGWRIRKYFDSGKRTLVRSPVFET